MQQVLDFWFDEAHQPFWFEKSDAFDQQIHEQFGNTHQRAKQCELWGWRSCVEGRLAEIIVLDQFSRNLFRDHPDAFAQDAMALALAQEAVSLKLDQQLDPVQRKFLYMPFMHSESLLIQDQSVRLFENLGNENNLDYAIKHREVIQRFGRFPHRNSILGRPSTVEESEFLKQPGSSF